MKKYAGEYAFGAVPYGYRKGEKKNTIAQILNEEKVMTPSVYLKLAGIRKNYKTKEFWTYESV